MWRTSVLTDGLSSQLAYVNYELDEGEEEQKPSPPLKSKSSKDDRRDKKAGDENVDGNAAEKRKGKDKGKDKREKDSEKPDKQSTGTISASVLKNAESLILKERLRRRDNGSAAQMDAAEERDSRQRELRKKKLAALQQVRILPRSLLCSGIPGDKKQMVLQRILACLLVFHAALCTGGRGRRRR